jgi:hypothetical protein
MERKKDPMKWSGEICTLWFLFKFFLNHKMLLNFTDVFQQKLLCTLFEDLPPAAEVFVFTRKHFGRAAEKFCQEWQH